MQNIEQKWLFALACLYLYGGLFLMGSLDNIGILGMHSWLTKFIGLVMNIFSIFSLFLLLICSFLGIFRKYVHVGSHFYTPLLINLTIILLTIYDFLTPNVNLDLESRIALLVAFLGTFFLMFFWKSYKAGE